MNRNEEIIRLLKHGRSDEVKNYVEEQKKQNYPEDFTIFMDQMIAENHLKRKDVAIRSGLSQDYTYKLLRGVKKTTERDYILAMCIAIGMNLPQIQHALTIYGMPILNRADSRSNLLYLAIENHLDIDGINEWLEKAGFFLLRTSTDMPSAPIELSSDYFLAHSANISLGDVKHTYEEIDRRIEAERSGNAPMDYDYQGILTVEDETGKKYHVISLYSVERELFLVLDEEGFERFGKNKDEIDMNDIEALEQYETFIDTASSSFFPFYLELDRATDKKVVEIMESLDDTRNYGIRIGAGFHGGEKMCYLEAFDEERPAERQYLQIQEKKGKCIYSASHDSCFMQMELGEIYPYYFGEKKAEYYLQTEDTAEIARRDIRLKCMFDDLRHTMHRYALETFPSLFTEFEDQIPEENISVLVQRATWMMHAGDVEGSNETLMESIRIMEEEEEKGKDYILSLIITWSKIASNYVSLGKMKEMLASYDKVCSYRDRISDLLNMNPEEPGVEDAIGALAESMLHKAQHLQNRFGPYDSGAKDLLKDAINLLEGKCSYEQNWITLFQLYTKYAYAIDSEFPEESAKYSRKAITVVNSQHLDRVSGCQMMIVTLYNNYAWVLWNKLGREEAVIYYGRAIELLEGYLLEGTQDEDVVKVQLKHVGEAFYKLYLSINRKKEAARLKERLKESGVEISL